ncbi:hypothetical protein [Roseiterribacter gracilis]|uniref:Uncharacterized protein n=1 Tax=Roseiterribacter gracilis TaxID=2812848 RepID=A0A8S8X9L4_9PROT|nr:hypothetical protein TMPK1_01470 [Rhodospirillales bacterium TMPK1]
MLFRREAAKPEIAPGSTYRRSRGEVVEMARVIAVVADPGGIPHVRFNLHIESRTCHSDEQRTLAVEAFSSLYAEPVRA